LRTLLAGQDQCGRRIEPHLSESAVEKYVSAIFLKLGLRGAISTVEWALCSPSYATRPPSDGIRARDERGGGSRDRLLQNML